MNKNKLTLLLFITLFAVSFAASSYAGPYGMDLSSPTGLRGYLAPGQTMKATYTLTLATDSPLPQLTVINTTLPSSSNITVDANTCTPNTIVYKGDKGCNITLTYTMPTSAKPGDPPFTSPGNPRVYVRTIAGNIDFGPDKEINIGVGTVNLNVPTSGTVVQGGPAQTFTVINNGNANVSTRDLNITAATSGNITVVNNCPKELQPGGSPGCTFTVSAGSDVTPNKTYNVKITADSYPEGLLVPITVKDAQPTKSVISVTQPSTKGDIKQGANVTYTVKLVSGDKAQVTNIAPVGTWPSGLSSDPSVGDCLTKPLTSSANSCTFTVKAGPKTTVGNYKVSVTADGADEKEAPVNVIQGDASLSIKAPDPATVKRGDLTGKYTVTLTSDVPATKIRAFPVTWDKTLTPPVCSPADVSKKGDTCTFQVQTTSKTPVGTYTVSAKADNAPEAQPPVDIVVRQKKTPPTFISNPKNIYVVPGKQQIVQVTNQGETSANNIKVSQPNSNLTGVSKFKPTTKQPYCDGLSQLAANESCYFGVQATQAAKGSGAVEVSGDAASLAIPTDVAKPTTLVISAQPKDPLKYNDTGVYEITKKDANPVYGVQLNPSESLTGFLLQNVDCNAETLNKNNKCTFKVTITDKAATPGYVEVDSANAKAIRARVYIKGQGQPALYWKQKPKVLLLIPGKTGADSGVFEVGNQDTATAAALTVTPSVTQIDGVGVQDPGPPIKFCGPGKPAKLNPGESCGFLIHADSSTPGGTAEVGAASVSKTLLPVTMTISPGTQKGDITFTPDSIQNAQKMVVGSLAGIPITVEHVIGTGSVSDVTLCTKKAGACTVGLPDGISAPDDKNFCKGVTLDNSKSSCSFVLVADKQVTSGTVVVQSSVGPKILKVQTQKPADTLLVTIPQNYFIPVGPKGGSVTGVLKNSGNTPALGIHPDKIFLQSLDKRLAFENKCGANLDVGASCQFVLSSKPNTPSGISGILAFRASNIKVQAPIDYITTDVQPIKNLVVTPDPLNLLIGGDEKTILVSNQGNVDLSQVSLDNGMPQGVKVLFNTCRDPKDPREGRDLPVWGSCQINVQADAKTATAAYDVFNIYSNETGPQPHYINVFKSGGGSLVVDPDAARIIPGGKQTSYTLNIQNAPVSGVNFITKKLPSSIALTNNCTSASYQAGDTCTFSLRASKDTSAGEYKLIIAAKDAPAVTFPIDVVVPSKTNLVITPAEQLLPNDAYQTKTKAIYTLHNYSDIPTAPLQFSVGDSPNYTVMPCQEKSLDKWSSCDFQIAPKEGATSTSITVTAGTVSAKAELTLSSQPLTDTKLQIKPDSAITSRVAISQGGPLKFTITDIGRAPTLPLVVNSSKPSGVFIKSDSCTGRILSPDGLPCYVTLSALRHAPITGVGHITVSALNAIDQNTNTFSPVYGYFKIKLTPPETTLVATPSGVVNITQGKQLYKITNVGNKTTSPLSVQQVLPDNMTFLPKIACQNATLAPTKGSCSFTLSPNNTSYSVGNVYISGANTNEVDLGAVINPNAPPNQQISLALTKDPKKVLPSGTVENIVPGSSLEYTVTNTGKGGKVVAAINIDTSDFTSKLPFGVSVIANDCGLYLQPNESCHFALYADSSAVIGQKRSFTVKSANSNSIQNYVQVSSGLSLEVVQDSRNYLNYRAVDVVNNNPNMAFTLTAPSIGLQDYIKACGYSSEINCEGLDAHTAGTPPPCYLQPRVDPNKRCRIWLKASANGYALNNGQTPTTLTINAKSTIGSPRQSVQLKANLTYSVNLYAGGHFNLNGSNVAKWGQGKWEGVGTNSTGIDTINALQLYKGQLYAGGGGSNGSIISWLSGSNWQSKIYTNSGLGAINVMVLYNPTPGDLDTYSKLYLGTEGGLLVWDGTNINLVKALGKIKAMLVSDAQEQGRPKLYIFGKFAPVFNQIPNFVEYDGNNWVIDNFYISPLKIFMQNYGKDKSKYFSAAYVDKNNFIIGNWNDHYPEVYQLQSVVVDKKTAYRFLASSFRDWTNAITMCGGKIYAAGTNKGVGSYVESLPTWPKWPPIQGLPNLSANALLCYNDRDLYAGYGFKGTPLISFYVADKNGPLSGFPLVKGGAVKALLVVPSLSVATTPPSPSASLPTKHWKFAWSVKFGLFDLASISWFSWFAALI